jgi:hypothetical protein
MRRMLDVAGPPGPPPASPGRPASAVAAWVRPLAAWVFVCVAGHAIWLGRPFVNQEQAFWSGARALVEPGFEEGFTRYWRDQAHPLGYPAIAAASTRLLGLPLAPWSVRLPSVAGGVVLLLAGWLLARRLRPEDAILFQAWAGAVTLNPLVFVYTGEATADVLPAGLATLALALAVRGRDDRRWHPVAAAVLAAAVLVKLNVVLLGAGVAFAVASSDAGETRSRPGRWRDLAWYAALPGVALALNALWVHARFGHLLFPERAWRIWLAPERLGRQWLAVFLGYASYLALLLGPLVLLALWRAWRWPSRARTLALASACAAAAASAAAGSPAGGEMGYGSFDTVLPGALATILRAAGAAMSAVLLGDMAWRARRAWSARLALAAVVPYLALSAFTRPAQRYLLLCLPLVFLDQCLAVPPGPLGPRRTLWTATVALFGGLSVVASVTITANGRAAERMTDWIESRGLLARTDPGALQGHTAHRFPLEPPGEPGYVVVLGEPGTAAHREPVVVLGRVLRTYSLVEREPRPAPR